MNHIELERYVYEYKTNSKHGFNNEEFNQILQEFPNINMEKVNNAMMGNTCILENGKIINYYCDVLKAIQCGIENRELTIKEWD